MPRAALYRGKQGCLALGYLGEHFRIAFQVGRPHLISPVLDAVHGHISKGRTVQCKQGYVEEAKACAWSDVAVSQVAVAIGLGMLFIVVNKTFDFLGDASVWIVITVGAQQMSHCIRSPATSVCVCKSCCTSAGLPVFVAGQALTSIVPEPIEGYFGRQQHAPQQ